MSIDWKNPKLEMPEVPVGKSKYFLIFTDKDSTRESNYCGGELCQDDDGNDFVIGVGFDACGGNIANQLYVGNINFDEYVIAWAYLETPDWYCEYSFINN